MPSGDSRTFPGLDPVFGSHGEYGGRRAPRDHIISLRLRDQRGKFRSNVVWLQPDWLGTLTIAECGAAGQSS